MFLNDTGYAEIIGVSPEEVYAERERGLRVEREVQKTLGVLTAPFRRSSVMTLCETTGGSYIETHPDISVQEMGAFEKDAKETYDRRRRDVIETIANRTAEVIPLFR